MTFLGTVIINAKGEIGLKDEEGSLPKKKN